MAELRALYLLHGEDHAAIAERRRRLRALAEQEGGASAVEVFEGERSSPQAVAAALSTMTLAIGRRVFIVDGVERWRKDELAELAPALAAIPPDTTVAFFAREDGRARAPAILHEAVKKARGQIIEHEAVKPWKLAEWVRRQGAPALGLSLDAAAARALVAQVGERQQRLLRELEKLALELGAGAGAGEGPLRISAEEIEARAARSTSYRSYALADALVGGDAREAMLSYLRVRRQGESLAGLLYVMAARMRDALAVSARLARGESPGEIRKGLRMPPRAAERFLADVGRAEPERLQQALGELADLELNSRGGARSRGDRSPSASLGEDTLALRAIGRIAG